MKKQFSLLTLLITFSIVSLAQRPSIELSFTAINNVSYVRLDSVIVMNKTAQCDTVLYWPDTLLVLDFVGVAENHNYSPGFKVFDNYPNPLQNQTNIQIQVPESGEVFINISDITGKKIISCEETLGKGTHTFIYKPGQAGLQIFTAYWGNQVSSMKMICDPAGGQKQAHLDYAGSKPSGDDPSLKQIKSEFSFSPGDKLVYAGAAGGVSSGITDNPDQNTSYTFQFATNIPCPGLQTVEYEGQVYNTIQIFSQCWMKENLNAGVMLQGSEEMTDNDIIEKYCYNNSEDTCLLYGGLYQWEEMMQYSSQEGVQGICPSGWHVPTDEEWKILEGAVDTHYGIGDQEWDAWGLRGYNACRHLKSTSGWQSNSGFDTYGFTALPGGCRYGGNFGSETLFAYFWTSSLFGEQYWLRALYHGEFEILRDHNDGLGFNGYSVRCLKD